jgi:VWFA-related protein
MGSRHHRLLLAALVALCVYGVAQDQPKALTDSQQTLSSILTGPDPANSTSGSFSSRVREVNVLFSVSDWHGHFVSNLTPADVRVLDNGQAPQSLTYFLRQSDLPLKVELLIDISGSVGPVFRDQRQAAAIFLEQTLRPSDSASIVGFGIQSRLVQDFTSNLESLTGSVRRMSAGESMTAIYDAVKNSCARLSTGEESRNRRALILITDGEDNSSHIRIDEAIDAALQSEVVIFALNTSMAPGYTDPVLQKLTISTGGRVLHARGTGELKSAFRKVNEQLRNQYLLGYKPSHWQADSSFHKIRLTARRFGVQVHCRKGYYAIE